MQVIKAVITDLDDTLLAPNKQISEQALGVIQTLQRQGVKFTFITGRPKYAIERFALQADIKEPIVSCNGAVIFQEGKIIMKQSFKISQLRVLMERAAALGLTVLFYTEDVEYALTETNWVKVRVETGRNFPVRVLSEEEWDTLTCEKINIMSDGLTEAFSQVVDMIQALHIDFSVAQYGLNGCEIVSKAVDKAIGMHTLAELMGVNVKEIMAIGDNANDNQMLWQAGLGVAVGNAKEETKQYADYICEKDYTEGVIEAIEKFVLKERCV